MAAAITSNPLPVASPGALVSVLFPRSGSASYPAALAVAAGAERRVDVGVGRRAAHLAEFGRSPGQASLAVALLGYVAAWRGCVVFASGRPVGSAYGVRENLERVLCCYIEAGAVPDREAHCLAVVLRPYGDAAPLFAVDPVPVPCRHVLRVFPAVLDPLHPSSVTAQVMAKSVAAGCDFCPLFRPPEPAIPHHHSLPA
jgi:hypothetical protein